MKIPFIISALVLAWAGGAAAVGTSLTYQGTLEDGGVAANGSYDFQFQLKTSGGTNIGSPISIEDVAVTGGVFTVQLDFGASAFPGANRALGIAVRPGASVAAHTALTPDAALNAAPYAQYANNALVSDSALDVANGSIDSVDIAPGAVGSTEIAADAVGASELANNSVGVANFIGANYTSPNNLNATIGANDCNTYDIPVGGGFEPGDSVILNATTAYPANVLIQALEVVSTNTVKIRFCNHGASTATVTNAGIRMISIR
jgi:hypothetical protein